MSEYKEIAVYYEAWLKDHLGNSDEIALAGTVEYRIRLRVPKHDPLIRPLT